MCLMFRSWLKYFKSNIKENCAKQQRQRERERYPWMQMRIGRNRRPQKVRIYSNQKSIAWIFQTINSLLCSLIFFFLFLLSFATPNRIDRKHQQQQQQKKLREILMTKKRIEMNVYK